MGVTKAREKFSDWKAFAYQNDAYIISRHGQPAAAVVPVEVYESWKQQRKELFALIAQFQEASGEPNPDEVMPCRSTTLAPSRIVSPDESRARCKYLCQLNAEYARQS